ncbi:hypothetical protein [Amaricoccus macauensis]|uniref:hypothetical protein n=1 Tax=Amaricoccus macauensis TaxID=57001 RepID=UPI003C7D297E
MADGPGLHTRVVAILKVGFPLLAAALLLSVFISQPSDEDGAEIVFSEADLEELGSGFQITNPTFTGTTRDGDPFVFEADLVVPDAAPPTRAAITRLRGRVTLSGGTEVQLSADEGELTIADRVLDLAGSVEIHVPGGYDLVADTVVLDLAAGTMRGEGNVEGAGPMGEIRSETLEIVPSGDDASERRFSFGNGVRLLYDPPAPTTESSRTP